MATGRSGLAGAGTNTAALAFGGRTTTSVACTESYNGSTWTAGGAMSTARCTLAGAGTNTAALAFGGFTTGGVACTESYNGSTWSAGGALGTTRSCLAGAGTNTAALAFGGCGGSPAASVACTESFSNINVFSNFQT